jgi:peroxiredoxin
MRFSAALLALALSGAARATPLDACMRRVLAASARAYRAVPALRDELRYVVDAPGAERETKTLSYQLANGIAVSDPSLQAVALGDRFYLVRSGIDDRYVSAPYAGDFAAALDAVVGTQGSLFAPTQVVMRTSKRYEAWLDSMRFKQLAPLRAVSCRANELRFEADNGKLTLLMNARTHFFEKLDLELRPPGAPPGFAVRIHGTFSPRVQEAAAGVVQFDRGSRTAVTTLAELGSTSLAVGAKAPDFELETLDGNKVALHALRGSVVVLDFWATWCVPCWKTLHETQALHDWAAQERLPVAVFAVDTLEQLPSVEQKKERARSFWQSQKLSMTALLDTKDEVFAAFQSPGLPSVVVIGSEGTIAAVHQGLFPDVLQTLKREVRAAVAR